MSNKAAGIVRRTDQGRGVLAIVPARADSRRLAGKHMQDLGGIPLIGHTIKAAQDSRWVTTVSVSTNDPAVRDYATGAGAFIIDRPAPLATDKARSEAVVAHAIEAARKAGYSAAFYILLQPTSPLRTAAHIDAAADVFAANGFRGSVVSVVETETPAQKTLVLTDSGELAPLTRWEDLTAPAQDLAKTVHPNGAIYIGAAEAFLFQPFFFAAPCRPFSMSPRDSIDIDTAADLMRARAAWDIAKNLARLKKESLSHG